MQLAETLLRQAVADPKNLRAKAHDLEDLLCEPGRIFFPERAVDLLSEISYDLAFYQPDPRTRTEDASLIDTEHAVDMIERTLEKLEDMDKRGS